MNDDAKMYCHIKNAADNDELQRGIGNFVDWTNKWQNLTKYKQIQSYVSTS